MSDTLVEITHPYLPGSSAVVTEEAYSTVWVFRGWQETPPAPTEVPDPFPQYTLDSEFGGIAAYVLKSELPFFNVKDQLYGAVGDWDGSSGHDDTLAIQAAINAATAAGGGVVIFPAGNYRVQPQTARVTTPATVTNQGHALYVDGSNVTLLGAGSGTTKLTFLAYGGGNPSSSWQTVSGLVFRGGGIYVVGGATAGTTHNHLRIEGLELDGGASYTGTVTFPANTGTGDGWDITHKGIWLENDKYHDNVEIVDCVLHNWRGEIVYGGGSHIGKVKARHCTIYGTNGDCWSVSGEVTVDKCEMYQAAFAAVEDAYYTAPCVYTNNYVHGCVNGFSILTAAGASAPFGNVKIEDNYFELCPSAGIKTGSPQNMLIKNNTFLDCSSTGSTRNITVDNSFGSTSQGARNVRIRDNVMLCSTVDVQKGIMFIDAGSRGFTGIEVKDNSCEVTALGVTNGKSITQPYDFAALNDTKAIIKGNTARGVSFQYTDQRTASDVLLTTTSATDVVKFRPAFPSNYLIQMYYRVVTAATNVTINLTYYDGSGAAQTVNVLTLTSKAVGSYQLTPVFINARGNSETEYIKVTVTAGTASQLYVSAVIQDAIPV